MGVGCNQVMRRVENVEPVERDPGEHLPQRNVLAEHNIECRDAVTCDDEEVVVVNPEDLADLARSKVFHRCHRADGSGGSESSEYVVRIKIPRPLAAKVGTKRSEVRNQMSRVRLAGLQGTRFGFPKSDVRRCRS